MIITKDADQSFLWTMDKNTIVTVNNESGMFVRYRGNGIIVYKTALGIIKQTCAYDTPTILSNY